MRTRGGRRLRPRALRPLSARIDVQACDRGCGAASRSSKLEQPLHVHARRITGAWARACRAIGVVRDDLLDDHPTARSRCTTRSSSRATPISRSWPCAWDPAAAGYGRAGRHFGRAQQFGRATARHAAAGRPTDRVTWWRRRCAWRGLPRRLPTAACCASRSSRRRIGFRQDARPKRLLSPGGGQRCRRRAPRCGPRRYGPHVAHTLAGCRQDRHRRGRRRAVARLVRRLRTARPGGEADRLRRAVRARGLRRTRSPRRPLARLSAPPRRAGWCNELPTSNTQRPTSHGEGPWELGIGNWELK